MFKPVDPAWVILGVAGAFAVIVLLISWWIA